ncbi:hypothetical protein HYH03_004835 [Edaphochlamys debaryana]|uniref:PAS domain-containing protein n=1 Tax=Edaphochlamys debaryana TaxID=47281 RepID=A0A835Y725_9CHLO|nr:hypothetical protein HYH03_004835 [Edaphochlamys debaryana]|eukprot:KAG2497251.1 hypothetical protein HYH03_004835 [Edaphochlamys debaryana]
MARAARASSCARALAAALFLCAASGCLAATATAPLEDWIIVLKPGSDCATFAESLCADSNPLRKLHAYACTGRVTALVRAVTGRFTRAALRDVQARYKDAVDHVSRAGAFSDGDSLFTGDELTQMDSDPAGGSGPARHRILPEQVDPVTWGLDRIDQAGLPLDGIYRYQGLGTGVNVYVVDSGVRGSHQQFRVLAPQAAQAPGWISSSSRNPPVLGAASRVTAGVNVLLGPNSVERGDSDCYGHGTHVASLVGGVDNGVAKNVTIHPVQVLDCSGNGNESVLLWGLDWVARNLRAPAVVHMSLEGPYSAAVNAQVEQLVTKMGAVVVVAAGNRNVDSCGVSPASAQSALTVAAIAADGRRWYKSNWGSCVDVFAPGVSIMAAVPWSDTAEAAKTGTSMAAPLVSGVAALYLEANPGASADEVTQRLLRSSLAGLVADDAYGYGTFAPNPYAGPWGPLDISSTPNRLLQSSLVVPARVSPSLVSVGSGAGGKQVSGSASVGISAAGAGAAINLTLLLRPGAQVDVTAIVPSSWDGQPLAAVYPAALSFSPAEVNASRGLTLQPSAAAAQGPYYVQLQLRSADPAFDFAVLTFHVNDSREQAGESAASARSVRSLPFSDAGSTAGFQHDVTTSPGNPLDTAPDVVYSLAPVQAMSVSVSTCGSSYDTVLLLGDTPDLLPYNTLANDDDPSCGPYPPASSNSRIDADLQPGRTYFFVVSGFNGASGSFRVSVTSNAEREEGDLLEQKKSLQEGVFQCMFTLVRQSALSSWKFAVLKMVLEAVMGLIVIFNPSVEHWRINTSNPVWQVVRWTVWRSPIMRIYGYDTYILVMYIMAGMVLACVLGLVWLTMAMRRAEQSKWLKTASLVVHVAFDVLFMMLYVSFFDYFVFTANCHYGTANVQHVYFEGVKCLEMPHILHMSIACVTAALFFCVTALMVVASCDLNPVSRGYLASPAAITRLKILTAKAAYIIIADCLQSWNKPQAILAVWAVGLITWWNFRNLPFYRVPVNTIWCSNWFGILYTCCILCYSVFGEDQSEEHLRDATLMVLYGIFPVIAGGMAVCWLHAWWVMRPARKFKDLEPGVKVAKIHKFSGFMEVELLSRVMREFDTEGVVLEDSAALGEAIIKAGMRVFPNTPFLLILYANFLLEVRKDGPASRTQLQLASKHSPSLIERYQIFCTSEASKRLKDSQDGGMDLQAYIEFRRNFRAVLRVHKEVLMLQADLWSLLLKTTLRVSEVDRALDALEEQTIRAHQVYKKVLERYPTNGKLLRCYGRFLEDVKHDPIAATRAYNEASRNGGGDAIMNLDLTGVQGAAEKPEMLNSMSMEDDAVIVINADGMVMMVSQAVSKVFGHQKAELEGTNVSLLMPQPFSQRHNGYLSRYTGGGEPHILDSVREVVALHKERYVFPISLCVTKMSGTGADSVFLAVARPLPPNTLAVKAWLAPNGIFLCGDQQFASLCGINEGELVGRSLLSMVDDPGCEVDALLERCRDASAVELASGSITASLRLKHRYLDPVPVEISMGLAGTDGQRILVLSCRRTDGLDGNIMVVDTHMKIRFASCTMATLLGFPMRKLATMRLDQLLPPPYNTMHAKYLRDAPAAIPPTSCRAGKVVNFLNENGSSVPARLKITSTANADLAMNLYVVQVEKVTQDEVFEEKRVVLTADFNGRVLNVSQPDSTLFDFRTADVLGSNLCDFVDIFDEWRQRNGGAQLQLLLLALLDKEQEMPSASWRVRVHAPASESAPHLPAVQGAAPGGPPKGSASKSACLQVELEESGEEAAAEADKQGDGPASLSPSSIEISTRIRVTLWRRDLLTGVVELDENLVIRKANPMTGLIVGMPSSAMSKKPLQHFLNMPEGATWASLTAAHAHHKQRSALKTATNRGTISPVMPFIGPHPDSGTMRILCQGVQVLAPGGVAKVTLTMHPDTAYVGAHADLMKVLHLNFEDLSQAATSAAGRHGGVLDHRDVDLDEHEDGGSVKAQDRPVRAPAVAGDKEAEEGHSDRDMSDHSDKEGDDPEAKGQAQLHRQAASKSDFVAQWVQALHPAPSGLPGSRPGTSTAVPATRAGTQRSGGLAAIPEGEVATGAIRAVSPSTHGGHAEPGGPSLDATMAGSLNRRIPSGLAASELGPNSKQPSRAVSAAAGQAGPAGGRISMSGSAAAGPSVAGAKPLEGPDDADMGDRNSDAGGSETEGSQANSGFTSHTDGTSASELQIDSRRGRLLRSLQKLMMGPMLMVPLERLRVHTYILILIMLVTHVVTYVVIKSEVKAEYHEITLVERQALAMDRSQLIVVRAMMGAFCERPNVTAKVSVCANSLDFTLAKLTENIRLMELHHQFVYLGESKTQAIKLMPEVYDIWTEPMWDYQAYLDTSPPRVHMESAGVWTLGSRFIAAAREALYWLPEIKENYRLHRTYSFLVTNGIGPLFEGYAKSLDYLVKAAWESVDELRLTLIILLAAEALVIQLSCLVYEWILVQRLEGARLTGVLAMYGLPGPVLRQLATREAKILDDDDDDDDDESDAEEDQHEAKGGKDEPPKSNEGADDGAGKAASQPHGGGGSPDKKTRMSADTPGGAPLAAQKTRRLLSVNKSKTSADGAEPGVVEQPQPRSDPAAAASANTNTALVPAGPPAAALAAPEAAAGRASGRKMQVQAQASSSLSSDSGTEGTDGGAGAATKEPRGAQLAHGGGPTSDRDGGGRRDAPSNSRVRGLRIHGKVLVPSYTNLAKFVVPFALYVAAVIVVYVISLVQLEGMQGPLASLNMASHVIYRYTRVRAIAFGFVSQDDRDSRELWREMLKQELVYFESEYDALMYGGTPVTQANSVFDHPVPASTFASASFATEFFRAKRCFRYEQESCFPEGHVYYEVSRNGLDVMVRRMLAEMTLLSEDDDADVAYNGTRYMFMASVGGNDLYEGLQQAAQLFVDYSIGRYDQVTFLHTILLIVTCFLVVLYVVLVLWPHLARIKSDAERQSALLSHVPPEVDVRGLVRAVFKQRAVQGRHKSQAGGRGGGKHEDVDVAGLVAAARVPGGP